MTYLSTDDRTQILLETIEDASKHVGEWDVSSISERMACKLSVAFGMVLAAAKRHPDYPKKAEVVRTPYEMAPGRSPAEKATEEL